MSQVSRRRSVSPAAPAPPAPEVTSDRLSRVLQEASAVSTDTSPTGDVIRTIDRFDDRSGAPLYTAGHRPINRTSNDVFPTDVPLSAAREELYGLHDTVASFTGSAITSLGSPSYAGDSRRYRSRTASERINHLESRRNRLSVMNLNVSDAIASLEDLEHAGQQLETASQNMRALLDDSQSILSHPSLAAEEYAGEAETNRAIKRRKINTGLFTFVSPGFTYGHYGQVEPGKLKMEIESCDGGTLEGYTLGSTRYTAANVLKNDDTVYCTKGNRCNLILRHQGKTPFSLTELCIKGPPRDYTDPVQEGMVFVSMENDETLVRTAQYQIQYAAPRHRIRLASRDPNNRHIISIRHNIDSAATGHENRSSTASALEARFDELDCRLAQLPADFTHQSPSPFSVTIECDDSDSDTNQPSRRRRATGRLSAHLGGLFSGDLDPASDSETSSDRDLLRAEARYLLGAAPLRSSTSTLGPPPPLQPRLPRDTAHAPPRNVSDDLARAVLAAQEATEEAVKAVSGGVSHAAGTAGSSAGLMAPLAWFFIERDKSKCIMRFDPPVSGRFILLKMWAPHFSEAGNIDIQSVVAKGFAGPRYFPASQPL